MRKISTLLMLFCAFVCSAWAGPTDLPEMTEDTNNPVWYAIKNVRSGKNVTYAGDAATMTQQASATAASFFYFTSSTEGAVKIHNYAAGDKLCAAYNSWTETGIDWYLAVQATGVSICTSTGEWNAWNDAAGSGQKVEYWSASDAGSAWEFVKITDFSTVIDVPAAKAAAIAELENLASVSTVYPAATTAIAAVNAVSEEDKSLAGLNAAVEAVNKVVADYKAAAYQALSGKYFTINTPARSGNGYMKASGASIVGTETAVSPANIWQFEYNDGAVSVFNPYTGLYLGTPGGDSSNIPLTADKAKYDLVVNAGAENENAKVKLTCDGKSVHMAGGGTLVRWDNGGASEWAVIEVADFSALIADYKASALATLESWEALPLVFDAALLASAETKINAISGTAWSTFALIDNEIKAVADAVAKKNYSFQTTATDNHRNGVYVGVPTGDTKARGIASFGNNALWNFHVQGTNLYLYNALSGKYLGTPASEATLSDAPSASYTFEIIDAEQNIVELKSAGGTLHASNWADDALINYDGDESASRWIVTFHDPAAELQELLDANASNHAVVPALGQYTTAAYNALKEARQTASTVAEIDAAKTAFEKAKNVPVYFITSAWDEGYPAGKAILYNGSAWRFDTANKFNRQMWMTIREYTNADVPTVGAYDAEGTSYGICDYLTSTLMRGKKVQIVAIEGWEGAYNLQYNADATSTDAAQHAQNGGALVNWKPATVNDCQASAWRVEYLGSSYELDQLTDEKIAEISAALATLETANSVEPAFGETVGYYAPNVAYATAKATADAILNKSVVELAATPVEEIEAAAAAINASLVLVTPAADKYYRIVSACSLDTRLNQQVYVNNNGGMQFQVVEDASNIANVFQFVPATDGKFYIYSVERGTYMSSVGVANATETEGAKAVTLRNMGLNNVVSINPDGQNQMHAQAAGSKIVGWTENNPADGSAWIIEEVSINDVAHKVTVTEAEWATLVLGYNAEIPEGVTAYAVTAVEAESATLTEVKDVLPANTPVLLNAEANDYSFKFTDAVAEVANNELQGSVYDLNLTEQIYVLGMIDGNVGFYKAKLNVNTDESNDIVEGEGEDAVTTPTYEAILSNAFKAYLPATASAAQALRFNFGGTTAIESVVNGIDANAAIYDLSGRRVEKATKGIYIVNGKKMIVK